jgi:hypothetical protein
VGVRGELQHEPFGGQEEPTPVCAERVVVACLPCLGRGTIHLVDGRREMVRRCFVCRGAGVRLMVLRYGREVFVADEVKVPKLGRCEGTFHVGRKAAFGRVACTVCGGRFRPLPGQRVPNHIAQRPPVKADPPRGARK